MSMSQASIPAFVIGLNALAAILDKAQSFAEAKKIDPAVLLSWRLAPDMYPLVRQVQIVAGKSRSAEIPGIMQMAVEPLPTMHSSGEIWAAAGHPVAPDKFALAVGAKG